MRNKRFKLTNVSERFFQIDNLQSQQPKLHFSNSILVILNFSVPTAQTKLLPKSSKKATFLCRIHEGRNIIQKLALQYNIAWLNNDENVKGISSQSAISTLDIHFFTLQYNFKQYSDKRVVSVIRSNVE